MLKIEHVTKRYGKTLANNDISFEVADGQIAILLGPNGAGKSTIIKCIAGLLRFQGSITLDGLDNKSLEAKRLLGYIPEMPAVYDLLTVEEHLEFIRRAYRMSDDGYGQALLERFELWDKKDKLGKELSKGMQQKLSIIIALLGNPQVLFLDEPTLGLDVQTKKKVLGILKKLARQKNVTIIITSHQLDIIDLLVDKLLVLKNGKIFYEGDPYLFKEMYSENRYTISVIAENIDRYFEKYEYTKEDKRVNLYLKNMNKDSIFQVISELYDRGYEIIEMKKDTADLEEIMLRFLEKEGDEY